MLKEFNDLDILGVTSDSKVTFEKHLCSVSRAASQRLGTLRKPWRVFHDNNNNNNNFIETRLQDTIDR